MKTVLEAFITTWVAHFGVPSHITTDRGTQFTSGTWGDWRQNQGVQHITTTAYCTTRRLTVWLSGYTAR